MREALEPNGNPRREKGGGLNTQSAITTKCSNHQTQPRSILFDSRLIKVDKIANPIVVVTGEDFIDKQRTEKAEMASSVERITRPVSSLVKGHCHVSVQTD